jgi:hypothetical protein
MHLFARRQSAYQSGKMSPPLAEKVPTACHSRILGRPTTLGTDEGMRRCIALLVISEELERLGWPPSINGVGISYLARGKECMFRKHTSVFH